MRKKLYIIFTKEEVKKLNLKKHCGYYVINKNTKPNDKHHKIVV